MKLIVIGSGSKGNSYVLQGAKQSLLLEAGVPIAKIKEGLNFNLNGVCGCLITHRHL